MGSARDRCEALEPLSLLAGLPERRRTFLASKVGGYSYEEIVAQLDVSWRMVDRRWWDAKSGPERARLRLIAFPTGWGRVGARLSLRTARTSGPFAFKGWAVGSGGSLVAREGPLARTLRRH